jgi:hypothetical protein
VEKKGRMGGFGQLPPTNKHPSSIANCLDSLKGHEEKVVVAFYTLYLSVGLITKKPEWFMSLLHTVGVRATWGL